MFQFLIGAMTGSIELNVAQKTYVSIPYRRNDRKRKTLVRWVQLTFQFLIGAMTVLGLITMLVGLLMFQFLIGAMTVVWLM